ncbi:MAG: ABC transporter ATP-binding protein [Bacteroidota bacterium]
MLKIKNISFSREKPILHRVNLSIKTGEFYGIVGPSGAGKSTLMKIIAGLLDADLGEVKLDGELILGPKDRLIPGNPNIQLVNQDFALDIYHTVYENLILKTSHLQKSIQDDFIEELLEIFELKTLEKHKAIELSGGEQQRLALARALALEPKIILLDEPFVHLDAHIKRKVLAYLLELKRIRKTTMILVSHDGSEMLSLADKIVYFDQTEIQRIDSPDLFFSKPKSYQEGLFFGDLNKIKHQKKEILFRPNNFFLENSSNLQSDLIELEVHFLRSVFYGNYSLSQFKISSGVNKNRVILLKEKDSLKMNEISNIFVLNSEN